MRTPRFVTAASFTLLAIVLAGAPAAAGDPPVCEEIGAKASTTWIKDTGVEVGVVEGLINGAIYLRFDDEADPIDPAESKPNMVIQTKEGDLSLWVYSKSTFEAPDRWVRTFGVMQAEGTGRFAGSYLKLSIEGQFIVEQGGGYAINGTLCTVPTKREARSRR